MSETLIKRMDHLRSASLYTRPELGSLVTEIFPRRDGFYDTFNLSRHARNESPTYTQFGILRSEGGVLVFGDEAYRAHERKLAEIAQRNDDGTEDGLSLTRRIQGMTPLRTDVKGVPYFTVAPGVHTMMIMVRNNNGESVYFSQERSEGEYVISLRPQQRVTPAMQAVTLVGQEERPQRELNHEDLVFAEQQFNIFSGWALSVLTPLPTIEPNDRNIKTCFLN